MDNLVELLQRRINREKIARKQAEYLIEEKSRELYLKGCELEHKALAEGQARFEAEIMLQAIEAFTSQLEHENIVKHLQYFLHKLAPHDMSEIYFLDEGVVRKHCSSSIQAEQSSMSTQASSQLLETIKSTLAAIVVNDICAFDHKEIWAINSDTRSFLAVPLLMDGHAIGCITLQSKKNNAFNHSEPRLAQALANASVIAFENARLFAEVKKLSTLDPLTGLNNRRYFNQALEAEFKRALRYKLSFSVVMMDIDFFKNVNDTYGHDVGDAVLVGVAAACLHGSRATDTHARYGGEEFCFLLPETNIVAACYFAERLREKIAALNFQTDLGILKVTASFGVAMCDLPNESTSDLLKRCDKSLYTAKGEGRNRVSFSKGAKLG